MIAYSWYRRMEAYAPPRSWGPWNYAGEHFGEARSEIVYRSIDDTPVIGRVRYTDRQTKQPEIKVFEQAITVKTDDTYGAIALGFQSLAPTETTVDVEVRLYGTPEDA